MDRIRKLSESELKEITKKAKKIIPIKVAYFADKMGVSYGRISIRHQRTRWGSCSSEGNLNFNALLMLMPNELVDYVVVHELAHRKELNHSKRFYGVVESFLPDYKNREAQLKEVGAKIIALLPKR